MSIQTNHPVRFPLGAIASPLNRPLRTVESSVPPGTKWAFTTRRCNQADVKGLSLDFGGAIAGDLILVRTLEIGQHKNVQLVSGRNAENIVGDHIVAVVGDRYAPDQFEASAEIASDACSLVAGGGIVGRVTAMNARMKMPTRVEPVGLLTDASGEVLNVAMYAIKNEPSNRAKEMTVIGVFGTAMNSGKTSTAASFCLGLRRAGKQVVGIKATGTGAFGDYNAFRDAGVSVMDFVDAGMATTYRMPVERVEAGFESLIHQAALAGADIAVVEFADGVFQQEAMQMLTRGWIGARLDGVLFAAYDSAGAIAGVSALQDYGLQLLAVSGLISSSPLASREAYESTGKPVMTRDELRDNEIAAHLIAPYQRRSNNALSLAA